MILSAEIDIQKTIQLLLDLQEIDYEVYLLNNEKNEKMAPIMGKKREYDDYQRVIGGYSDGLKQLNVQIELLTTKHEGLGEKIAELEQKNAEIKTKKELEALENEIDFVKEERKNISEELQERRVEQKEINLSCEKNEGECAELTAEIEAEEGKIKEEISELEAKIAEIETKRPKFVKSLDERVYHEYERIRKHRSGPWVVSIYNNEACSGCYVKLPMQSIIDIVKNEDIVRCQNCARLLYTDGNVVPPIAE